MNLTKTMYDIREDEMKLMRMIEDNEGEITPEIEEALKINEEERVVKAQGYLEIINKLEYEVQRYKTESKRLAQAAKTMENQAEFLKQRLVDAAKQFGEIELPFNTIKLRKSEGVVILDQSKIPAKFIKVKTTYTTQNAEIKKAIKAGENVPGAIVEERQNLSVQTLRKENTEE